MKNTINLQAISFWWNEGNKSLLRGGAIRHEDTSISSGFTLAETIITLAIIGIVAALTIPSVIQNYKKHEASTRVKKFVGLMDTTITKAKFDGKDWPKVSIELQHGTTNVVNITKKYVKIIAMKKNSNTFAPTGSGYLSDIMVLPDGSYFVYDTQWGTNLVIGYDVNGDKKPNVNGKDRFLFYYCPEESGTWNVYCTKRGKLEPYWFKTQRSTALSSCRNDARYCSSVLWLDGFEFKKDYPHKL